ncbi:MAG: BMP family ABC transporter substrate-binding protein, partial [Proteobacteria bacterium]|nr:BMP family ABC transporter substrate-binding protein [Pseudomonadota bacterium]
LAPDVAAPVRERIERVAAEIADGRLHVPTSYDGPEFATPA